MQVSLAVYRELVSAFFLLTDAMCNLEAKIPDVSWTSIELAGQPPQTPGI
jgi:hypothetical protein